MVFFPNCKINLGLRILRKRPDGYHDLQTVFYPLPLKDVLEVVRSTENSFHADGLPIPAVPGNPGDPGAAIAGGFAENNLCTRAWQLLKKDFPDLSPIELHLYKNIPIGAGLGGGSADGAGMLQLLNHFFHLGLTEDQLLAYAARLGSDCPFFIKNKPCLASGRGEILKPISLDLSAYSFLLVHPGIHVSTALAFSQVIPAVPERSLEEIIAAPINTWTSGLINDFEAPVLRQHPELAPIKEKLLAEGALYAAMTGSGSSFFGIFEKGKLPSVHFDQPFKLQFLN